MLGSLKKMLSQMYRRCEVERTQLALPFVCSKNWIRFSCLVFNPSAFFNWTKNKGFCSLHFTILWQKGAMLHINCVSVSQLTFLCLSSLSFFPSTHSGNLFSHKIQILTFALLNFTWTNEKRSLKVLCKWQNVKSMI